MKKYRDYEDILVNNLQYERPATKIESIKQVPLMFFPGFNVRKNVWDDHIDLRLGRHKYWYAECIDCGDIHIVRADKIKTKQCRHIGTKHKQEKTQ